MRLLTSIIYIIFIAHSCQSQVVINEYSAANFNAITDNYGQYEDWFELYNTSGTAINLNGYYLSDKNDNLTKWQFSTDLNIAANDHQIILLFWSKSNN